jgi:formate C-acetyltransferase
MEKGVDVMFGGSKYSGYAVDIIGIGNVADSMQMIKHLCFDQKLCTPRELYDALTADWEGYEELRRYVQNKAPHYGNGDPEADRWVSWLSDVIADFINAEEGSYCRYSLAFTP